LHGPAIYDDPSGCELLTVVGPPAGAYCPLPDRTSTSTKSPRFSPISPR